MQAGNNIPLYKRTHWRRFKEFITDIAEYEKINIANYDLSKITCYETIGDGLKGKNVTYSTTDNNSCWVSDNKYDVYEIPAKSNLDKYSYTGHFIFAACNRSFNDDWIVGTMSVSINYKETKRTESLVENVHFNPYGKYTVTYTDTDCNVTKEKKGKDLTYGAHVHNEDKFDTWNVRRQAYTGKKTTEIITEICGKNKSKKIISTDPVKKRAKKKK